jgi:hypothetical protein
MFSDSCRVHEIPYLSWVIEDRGCFPGGRGISAEVRFR